VNRRAIAHDLSNMLAAVTGFSELAAREVPEGTPGSAHLAQVQAAAQRCTGLVRRLCVEEAEQECPEDVDLNGLLHETEPLIRQLAGADVAVSFDLSDQPALVSIVLADFERLIVNLVVNASDAMPAGGVLSFTTCLSGDKTQLVVRDTGSGMSREVQAHAFDPYFTTKGTEGTGIGLTAARQTVERANGTLSLASTLGRGTALTIRLPSVAARHPVAGHSRHSLDLLWFPNEADSRAGIPAESPLARVRAVFAGDAAGRG
jgi:two-component system cell cycle sensor histidine kinase/response regulator CckA